jgi:transcriptional regulator with XRE-family HTH domain
MTNTDMLERLIKDSGLKLSFIAEKLGITRQALYKKIKGLVQFTGPEIKVLCELLNLKTWARIQPVFFADKVSKNDYIAG